MRASRRGCNELPIADCRLPILALPRRSRCANFFWIGEFCVARKRGILAIGNRQSAIANPMKVAIAAGGTGGHLFPGLAVAEVLLDRGHEPLIFISEKDVDALATKDRTEFRFEKLPSIGLPKLLSPAVFGFFKKFRESVHEVRAIYQRFQPDAVL